MSFITVDFETYYSSDFSLSKLTTEEYVRSPRFEIIGVGICVDGGKPVWISGTHEEIRAQMLELAEWSTSAVLCHNTLFDGAILEWVLNIHPEYYYDTLSMARALHGVDAGGSLAKLVQRYSLGEKGTEVINAMGKRRDDFTASELARYGDYCINDVTLTSKLFTQMAVLFPEAEFDLVDMTLKMFLRPILKLDDALLVERLETVREEKRQLLAGLMQELNCEDEEAVRKKLCSNQQFAAILEQRGVSVPMKISPTTGKETFALAKNDEGFIALQEHEDPIVQQLCAVRLGTKSTLEESRIERFIGIGQRNRGALPIPLKYYGAHTGRWAGMDSVNFQNLPSRDKKKKALKNSIVAPPGHVIINCDSSQIEARVLAWLAGQDDLTTAFREGRDVYSEFATQIYGFKVSKEYPVERFVGKTCILGLGYGTGAAKLRHTLKTTPPGADLTETRCKEIVDLYRSQNYMIPRLWNDCDLALKSMTAGVSGKYFLDEHECVRVCGEGIQLPNGLFIRYPGLMNLAEGGHAYISRKGMVKLWGGAVVENIVQALARIIVADQLLQINKQFSVALTVHDAGVWVVPKHRLDYALAFISKTMSTPPSWCADLPVACEAKYGMSYGEC